MSGPLRRDEVVDEPRGDDGAGPVVEITPSRESEVGGQRVRRALPRRARRTVGPWCFADHIGPGDVDERHPFDVGPHPHIGLQTVTWLLSGELLHRDSLGSEQLIRPGQLNLMTAGHGVSHAEEGTGFRGTVHGIQLWVAQPESTRHGEPEFEHHASLPCQELGSGTATVLVGTLGDVGAPGRQDTESIGVDLDLRAGRANVPLSTAHEHAVVVLSGGVDVDGQAVGPGQLGYLGRGRDELVLGVADHARLLLLGGVPFESPIVMWWNFVARSTAEIDEARLDWGREGARFGTTGSPLDRIPAPPTPWQG